MGCVQQQVVVQHWLGALQRIDTVSYDQDVSPGFVV